MTLFLYVRVFMKILKAIFGTQKGMWGSIRRHNITLGAYLLLVPSFLIIFIFLLYPALKNIYFSLFDFSLINPVYKFVGIRNYLKLLSDPLFWQSLKTTILFTSIVIILQFFLGIGLALFLNRELKSRFIRPLSLIPYLTSSAIAALIFRLIWDAELGPINSYLKFFGIQGPAWIGNPDTALICVSITEVWKNMPFVAVVLLAGLQSLPQHPFDAAKVDGASHWQTFLYVTLPLLKPIILIILLFQTVFTIRAFDIIWILTEGGPAASTTTLAILVYRTIFRYWNAGYGAVVSVFVLFFTIVLTLIFITKLFREFEK